MPRRTLVSFILVSACVVIATHALRAAVSDIVLYAADSSNIHGNWVRQADPLAAGGQTMASIDRGWANVAAPLQAPADYFDFTFTAPSATSYHLWIRMRAAGNSKYNDSVFVQVSDARDTGGNLVFAIGSTSGLTVNLATDSAASGLMGWGWQSGAYWLTQTSILAFSSSGTHTLRIQTREDGVSIDQVILSPASYLVNSPGLVSGDSTIVPKTVEPPLPPIPPPPPVVSNAPAAYAAITDRNSYVKPPLPVLGAAGFAFTDPTFGSALVRVTDGRTRPGLLQRSFRVPSNAHLSAWNATSTTFYVISNDGTVIPYMFNAATMTASRFQPAATGNGGLTLGFYVEPQFSLVNPNVIYGAVSGANNRTISQYDFQSDRYTALLNLDTIVSGLTGTYVGGVMSGGTPSEALLTFFGGAAQDLHYYALWAPVANMAGRKILNTMASTINGVATSVVLNFHLHSAQIDRSGRYVVLYPTAVDLNAPRFAPKDVRLGHSDRCPDACHGSERRRTQHASLGSRRYRLRILDQPGLLHGLQL